MTATASGTATTDAVPTVDLAFVGAGVSTAYVLMSLLAALASRPPGRPVSVAVLEPDDRPFTGVAYGGRAAAGSLLITDLHDFLPAGELELFRTWLVERGDRAFTGFREAAGPVTRRWWDRHHAALARGDVDGLYLPRRVFGDHLSERVQAGIDAARTSGTADTRVVQDRVLAITPVPGGHRLDGAGTTLLAGTVVLAVGSPPVASRLRGEGSPTGVLVDRPFDSMDAVQDQVRAALTARRRPGPPHVVVIGGNAGAMDVLHLVADLGEEVLRGAVVTVLSPGGRLPARATGSDDGPARSPRRLSSLAGSADVRAADVHDAAVADIAEGEAAGLSAARTLGPVSAAVGQLLPRLSPDQAREFAVNWGVELGRHQRRAGWEYHEVVDDLVSAGRLQVVPGSLADAWYVPEGVCVRVTHDGNTAELPLPADVVLNCTGPARDFRDMPVVADLVATGTCRGTGGGRGIAVDDDLSAAPGLYVMGPLLAGNLVDGSPLWHLEHCGRISSLGAALGLRLAEQLTTPLGSGDTASWPLH